MKYYYTLLIASLLFSCVSPQKLLEKRQYNRTLELCLRHLAKGKVNPEYIDALEEAQTHLFRRDSQKIHSLLADAQANDWPTIYKFAKQVNGKQQNIAKVEQRLTALGYSLNIPYYPIVPLLKDAKQNSAIYYYALAQEKIPLARSGDRLAAREAWENIRKSRKYIDDFQDTPALEEELYQLGVTHVRVNVKKGRLSNEFTHAHKGILLSRLRFPYKKDWVVVHSGAYYDGKAHYDLNLYFDAAFVGPPLENEDHCYTEVQVEDGFCIREEWSEEDSAYVEIKEIIYKTVSANVITLTQSRNASVHLIASMIDLSSNREILSRSFASTEQWTNVFSIESGDARALVHGSCHTAIGNSQVFPWERDLLRSCVYNMAWDLGRFVKRRMPVN
jgi:hypothetical protein